MRHRAEQAVPHCQWQLTRHDLTAEPFVRFASVTTACTSWQQNANHDCDQSHLGAAADGLLDEANQQLVEFLMREEVARHVTAMYSLERIAAKDWARTRTLMASINQVGSHTTSLACCTVSAPTNLPTMILRAVSTLG